jgi:hypothetical protein
LTEAGTSFSTAGSALVLVDEEELELVFEPDPELLLLLLLLPHAATVPRHKTSTGTANQVLQLCIGSPRRRDQKSRAA